MSHKAYPAYKPSGVEWLGEIPAHWEVQRLKNVATVNPASLPESTPPAWDLEYVDIGNVDSNGVVVGMELMSFDDAPSRARRRVCDGDTIISTVRTYLKAVAYMDKPPANRIVSTGFAVLRPREEIQPKFLWQLVQSAGFINAVVAHSEGVSYPAIAPTRLACLPVWIPPKEEQVFVADFLDRETAKIDVLIEKKEGLIELLQEKRTALITYAVTKGLDPTVPMKDSGIEWLGHIPGHWEVRRLKYLTSINDEALPESTDPDFEISYADIGNVDPTRGITDREPYVFANAPSRARRIVQNGDVIISTVRTYLRAIAPIVDPEPNLIVSTGFAVIRPRRYLDPGFAAYALQAPYFVERVVANSVGVSYPAINATKLGGFPIALPSQNEQGAIADFLDGEAAKIDALIDKIQEAIGRLKEYRTALISAAVTGKIDVREEILA